MNTDAIVWLAVAFMVASICLFGGLAIVSNNNQIENCKTNAMQHNYTIEQIKEVCG